MKIHFYTFGCKVNQYDTQSVKESLLADGHAEAASVETADAIIINSCTVTAEADRQCRQMVRRMLRLSPSALVIIAGCYSKRARREIASLFRSEPRLIVADSFEAIPKILSASGKPFPAASSALFSALPLKNFSEKSRAYVKIQDGCDQFCSYCIVPTVRSQLASRPPEEVLDEVDSLVSNGYPEIVLCGVRLGRYAPRAGYFLEDIVAKLIALRGDFRIRLSSIEINEITPRLIALMKKNPRRICPHLHIPLQSGSDEVLKKMNRPYTSSEYEEKVCSIKKEFTAAGVRLTLTTDIIIGFLRETDEDFDATRALCEKIGFAKLHIFPYSARPGTAASKMLFRRDAVYLKKLAERKKNLFGLAASLEKSAREASERRTHTAVAIGKGWILTEDYQYYKIGLPSPDGIFEFRPYSPIAVIARER
ncbi:MAG: MiaB/RimO family radical SAM methylthiotransferase [Endomicrobiia bacterium]|nr:MiaB/RimO family radical SAM methylthiotransferase [Endomicrobiia bacterium]